jgi:uncharacterized coiled-coil protein SlyX
MDQHVIDAQNDKSANNHNLDKIENTLKELSNAVADQKKYLEKQTAAMEKLTQSIKQLEQTLKKEINLESRQSNSQLDELIKLFVEYDINPQFYHEHKMLKSAPPAKSTQIVKRKHSSSDK